MYIVDENLFTVEQVREAWDRMSGGSNFKQLWEEKYQDLGEYFYCKSCLNHQLKEQGYPYKSPVEGTVCTVPSTSFDKAVKASADGPVTVLLNGCPVGVYLPVEVFKEMDYFTSLAKEEEAV